MTERISTLLQARSIDPAQAFSRAAALHAQGQVRDAEQLYEVVLARDARHFESAHRLGLIRLQDGRFVEAEALFRRAVKLDKRSADAQHHLAIVLTALGRLDEAIAHYQKAFSLRPSFAEAHNNLGHALQLLGRYQEASRHYKKALAIFPSYAEAHNNLGTALAALGQNEEAVAQYQKALAINPDYAEGHNNLATALAALERHEEAVGHCEKALALRPNYCEAYLNLANSLVALERREEAVARYEKALAIDPENAEAHNRLGHLLYVLERTAQATIHCERAVALGSPRPETHEGIALLLWKLKRREDALASFDRALAIKPDYVSALLNRANVLLDFGRVDEALAAYAKAQSLEPANPDAHFHEAMTRLRLGDFARGFEKYEYRSKVEAFSYLERDFGKPNWLGAQDIHGKTILIHSEQGLGDTLQFCRYVEFVAGKGAKVVLEVQAALKSLLASLVGVDTIIAKGEPRPGFDFHCSIMSLPFAFKTTLETIPANTPYLRSSPDLVASWARKLGPKHKPRVGLVWSGNPDQMDDHSRSMRLSDCLPLFQPGIQLVSLQKEVRERDREFLNAHSELLHFGDEIRDFSDTAALACSMDLVISVCTSVGHLAGALHRPTWFVLSHAADWRWLLDREDCPWYPSARLFRQPKLGDWASVMHRVATALGELYGK